jgi:hypothetical protein
MIDESGDHVCLENTQSAQGSRGRVASSLAVLDHITHVEKSGPSGGDQHRLPQTKFADQLGRDGERQDQESQKLERTADPIAPHRLGLILGP